MAVDAIDFNTASVKILEPCVIIAANVDPEPGHASVDGADVKPDAYLDFDADLFARFSHVFDFGDALKIHYATVFRDTHLVTEVRYHAVVYDFAIVISEACGHGVFLR